MKRKDDSAPKSEREEVILLTKIKTVEDSAAKLVANAQKKASEMVAEARNASASRLASVVDELEESHKKAIAATKELAAKGGKKILDDQKAKISKLKPPPKQKILDIFEKTVSEDFRI